MPHKVLIVDDEQSIRMALKRAMELSQFVPLVADSGLTAIDLIKRGEKFDAAIIDLMLPDMTGIDLITWIKENDPGLTIFAISALTNPQTNAALNKCGVQKIISKPFEDIFEIPKIVQQALQRGADHEGKDQN